MLQEGIYSKYFRFCIKLMSVFFWFLSNSSVMHVCSTLTISYWLFIVCSVIVTYLSKPLDVQLFVVMTMLSVSLTCEQLAVLTYCLSCLWVCLNLLFLLQSKNAAKQMSWEKLGPLLLQLAKVMTTTCVRVDSAWLLKWAGLSKQTRIQLKGHYNVKLTLIFF